MPKSEAMEWVSPVEAWWPRVTFFFLIARETVIEKANASSFSSSFLSSLILAGNKKDGREVWRHRQMEAERGQLVNKSWVHAGGRRRDIGCRAWSQQGCRELNTNSRDQRSWLESIVKGGQENPRFSQAVLSLLAFRNLVKSTKWYLLSGCCVPGRKTQAWAKQIKSTFHGAVRERHNTQIDGKYMGHNIRLWSVLQRHRKQGNRTESDRIMEKVWL